MRVTAEIDELCRQLQPVLGDRVRRLWALYYASKPKNRRWVELRLRSLAEKHLDRTFEEQTPLLTPPPALVSDGEYPLGTVTYGDLDRGPFGLREKDWIQHMGIFGRSGSGKTNVTMLVLRELAKHQKPWLVMDWKRNYRDILPSLPDTMVFTVGWDVCPFRFNPLIPPDGTPARIWLKKLISIAAEAYFLGEGVRFLMQNALDSVYRDFGVYDGNNAKWPTVADVMQSLRQQKTTGRRAEWMASTVRAVGSMSFGEFGRVLNCQRNYPLGELLKRRVILELDALTAADKTFFTEALLLWIHHYRMTQPDREVFKHAIVIEEAHHILLKKKQEMIGGETVTDTIIREIRELGESIIVIDQHPSQIAVTAQGNTATTICLNLKHADDVRAASNAIGLQGDQRRVIGEIPVGTAVARVQGRWRAPFLVRFPDARIQKGTTSDLQLQEHMDSLCVSNPFGVLESRYIAERVECFVEEMRGFLQSRTREDDDHAQQDEDGPGDRGPKLARDELAFLKDVAANPFDPTQDRYARLRLSFHRGNRLRDSLADKGLMQIVDVRSRSGRVKLFEATTAGRELLKEHGITTTWRHGGAIHGYWVRQVARGLTQGGWNVETEKPVGSGATTDIVASKNGFTAAVEVETGKSDIEANMRKCANAGFGHLLLAGTDAEATAKLASVLEKAPPNGIHVEACPVAEATNRLDSMAQRG